MKLFVKTEYTHLKLFIYEGMGFQQAELGNQLYSLCQPFTAVSFYSTTSSPQVKKFKIKTSASSALPLVLQSHLYSVAQNHTTLPPLAYFSHI